jgi:hypothetical protein
MDNGPLSRLLDLAQYAKHAGGSRHGIGISRICLRSSALQHIDLGRVSVRRKTVISLAVDCRPLGRVLYRADL